MRTLDGQVKGSEPRDVAGSPAALPNAEVEAWLASRRGGRGAATGRVSLDSELSLRLEAFVRENETPGTSANYKSREEDDLLPLLELVGSVVDDHKLLSSALTCLKILSRKQQNRRAVVLEGFERLASCADFVANVPTLAAECANVVLNFCYEKRNVGLFLSCRGVDLLDRYLESKDAGVQASTAGALQSVSFHEEGRRQVRERGGLLPKIVGLLGSSDPKVKARAVGALHNLSSDPSTIHVI